MTLEVTKRLGRVLSLWIFTATLVVSAVVGFVLGGLPGETFHSLGMACLGGCFGSVAAFAGAWALWRAALGSDLSKEERGAARVRVIDADEERRALAELEAELELNEALEQRRTLKAP